MSAITERRDMGMYEVHSPLNSFGYWTLNKYYYYYCLCLFLLGFGMGTMLANFYILLCCS